MRYLLIASLVLMVASVAFAATPSQVPDSTLAMMGISGLQPMTDVQGTDVRGMAFLTAKVTICTPCEKITVCAAACGSKVCLTVLPCGTTILTATSCCCK